MNYWRLCECVILVAKWINGYHRIIREIFNWIKHRGHAIFICKSWSWRSSKLTIFKSKLLIFFVSLFLMQLIRWLFLWFMALTLFFTVISYVPVENTLTRIRNCFGAKFRNDDSLCLVILFVHVGLYESSLIRYTTVGNFESVCRKIGGELEETFGKFIVSQKWSSEWFFGFSNQVSFFLFNPFFSNEIL